MKENVSQIGDVELASGTMWRPSLPARDWRLVLYCLSLLLDCTALVGAFLFSVSMRDSQWLEIGGHAMVLVALPIFVMFEIAREVQSVEALASRIVGTRKAIGALGATAMILVLLSFLNKDQEVSRFGFAVFVGVSALGIIASKLLLGVLVNVSLGDKAITQLLILDGVPVPRQPGMDLVDAGRLGIWPDLGEPDSIDRLSRIIAPYDRVVVACLPDRRDAWSLFLKGSDVGGEILVDNSVLIGAVAIGECGGSDTLILSQGPLSIVNRVQKRVFDLAIGVPLALFLAPLMLVVALLIRLETPGPVLFRQVRVGQGNRQFLMYKFRSMRLESTDHNGNRSASRDDDRITRVGRFIRRTSIDELPQLLNVLRGEMSLVGPRPHALGSTVGQDLFWEVSASYWLRHSLKPGITGLAQIRGFRGATVRPEDLTRRLRCDLEYVTNWSIWSDFLILFGTFRVVVHKNAY